METLQQIFGEQWADRGIPVVRQPSGLIADPGDGRVYLEWNPNLEDDLAGYRVYRAASGGAFGPVSAELVTTTEWIDSGLTNGQTYRYAVRAVNRAGEAGPDSNITTVQPRAIQAPVIEEGMTVV
jgi:hypothetical protein